MVRMALRVNICCVQYSCAMYSVFIFVHHCLFVCFYKIDFKYFLSVFSLCVSNIYIYTPMTTFVCQCVVHYMYRIQRCYHAEPEGYPFIFSALNFIEADSHVQRSNVV